MSLALLEILATTNSYISNHVLPSIKNLHKTSEGMFKFDVEVLNFFSIADGLLPVQINNVVYHIRATGGAQLLGPPASDGKAWNDSGPVSHGQLVYDYFLAPSGAHATLTTFADDTFPKGLEVKFEKQVYPGKKGDSPPPPKVVVQLHGELDRDKLLAYLFPTKQKSQEASKSIVS